ncbi:lysozyme inhibitor LprI family protein [Pantoea dispersa]|uniref:lysozyme inhibitor LprI family protein n=1 Tax=Pantoea dispersa TaxID=59814 RepID=UPI000FD963E7|nr:lysozyme inhibitor LprI family protein [Pantoea dispersa]RVU76110.1 DUF1311 domain-containing protein [Pantoea dispersa]
MCIKPNEAATILINKAFNSNDYDGYSRLKLKPLIKLDRLTLKTTPILICLYLYVSQSALAAALCSSEPSDSAVYQCTLHEKQLAEDALNQEYTAAKKRIASSYRADKKLADDYLSTLTNTQRGWLKYRDGQCKLEAFDAEEGSIAHEVATNICIVRINKERLESLRQIPY